MASIGEIYKLFIFPSIKTSLEIETFEGNLSSGIRETRGWTVDRLSPRYQFTMMFLNGGSIFKMVFYRLSSGRKTVKLRDRLGFVQGLMLQRIFQISESSKDT